VGASKNQTRERGPAHLYLGEKKEKRGGTQEKFHGEARGEQPREKTQQSTTRSRNQNEERLERKKDKKKRKRRRKRQPKNAVGVKQSQGNRFYWKHGRASRIRQKHKNHSVKGGEGRPSTRLKTLRVKPKKPQVKNCGKKNKGGRTSKGGMGHRQTQGPSMALAKTSIVRGMERGRR